MTEPDPVPDNPPQRPGFARAITLPKRLVSAPFRRMASVRAPGRRSEGAAPLRRNAFFGQGDQGGGSPLPWALKSDLPAPARQLLESALVGQGVPRQSTEAAIRAMAVWEVSEGQTVLDTKEEGFLPTLVFVENGIVRLESTAQAAAKGRPDEALHTAGSAFLVERSKTRGGLLACTAARLWLLHDLPSVVSQPEGVQSPAEAELIPAVYSKHADDAAGVGLVDSLVASPNGRRLSGTATHKTSAAAPLRKEGAAPSIRGGKPSSVAKSSPGAFPEGSDLTLEGLSKLERLAVLGCGAFAYVLLVRRDQKYYALKVLSKAHIVKKGLQSREEPLSEEAALFYAACVVQGLDFLHQRGIVWRDLKPENLLLDAQGYLRLADFGFATQLDKKKKRAYTICGTPEYLAPEILLQSGHDFAVDWWALGVLVYEMVTGATPFPAEDRQTMFKAICDGRFTVPSFFSKELKDLVRRLLCKQPLRRLGAKGAAEVRRHPWFAKFDWRGLGKRGVRAPYVPKLRDPEDLSHFPEDQHVPAQLLGTGASVPSGAFADF